MGNIGVIIIKISATLNSTLMKIRQISVIYFR